MIRECCIGLLLGGSLAAAASGETAGEVMRRHIRASGGGKYLSLKTVRMSGRWFVTEDKVEAVVMELVPASHQLRMEITQEGGTDIRVYDGHLAWVLLRSHGDTSADRLTGDGLRQMKDLAHFQGRLFDYLSGGGEVEYLEKGELDGVLVFQLRLPDTDGEETTVTIDARSYLELKEERAWSGHGETMVWRTRYSDFRSAQGLTLPYKIEMSFKETAGVGIMRWSDLERFAIDKIELNVDLPASRFARPKNP